MAQPQQHGGGAPALEHESNPVVRRCQSNFNLELPDDPEFNDYMVQAQPEEGAGPSTDAEDFHLSQEDHEVLSTQLDFEDYDNYEWGNEGGLEESDEDEGRVEDEVEEEEEEEEEVQEEVLDFEDENEEDVVETGGRVKRSNMAMTNFQFLASRIPTSTKRSNEGAVKLFNMWTVEYNREYGTTWCENIEGVHDEDLPWHLASWLQGLLRPTGEEYNASSLNTYCNAMARHLRQSRHIDIKRDPDFYDFQQILKARQQDAADAGQLPGINAMNPLSKQDLEKAWQAGRLGMQDPKSAAATFVMYLIGMCGFRSVEEVYQTRNSDFTHSLATNNGVPDHISVSERISKMRRGHKGGVRLLEPKLFAYHNNPDR